MSAMDDIETITDEPEEPEDEEPWCLTCREYTDYSQEQVDCFTGRHGWRNLFGSLSKLPIASIADNPCIICKVAGT